MGDLKSSIILDLHGNLERQADRFSGSLNRLGTRGQRAMSGLRRSIGAMGNGLDQLGNRYTAMLTGIGVTYLTTQAIMDSGRLDKGLIRTSQTAGATTKLTAALRKELHAMSKATGQDIEVLKAGFDALIQSGLDWESSLATIMAINPAMAVTGAKGETLAGALGVGGEIFDKDLSKVAVAIEMLDQMTVAGRLGNAELEDLSSIFARVGANAKAAGLSFSGTLGFAEGLSMVERNPERLATLVDSTLRLFTNDKYRQKAQKVTGVPFYNEDKSRRSAFDVLDDLAKKFKAIKTDQGKDKALAKAFEGADLDTLKGLRLLFGGDYLRQMRTITAEVENASGTIARDLPGAIDTIVDQLARFKSAVRETTDGMSQPVNTTIKDAIKNVLDDQKLSGKEILAGGAVLAAGTFGLIKGGGKLMSKVGGGVGSIIKNTLGTGLGRTPIPVYVVNKNLSMLPGKDGFGLGPNGVKNASPAGAGVGLLKWAGAGLAGFGAGYGAGALWEKYAIGGAMSKLSGGKYSGSGAVGSWLYDAMHNSGNQGNGQMAGTLKIEIDSPNARARVKMMQSHNLDLDIDSGQMMRSH